MGYMQHAQQQPEQQHQRHQTPYIYTSSMHHPSNLTSQITHSPRDRELFLMYADSRRLFGGCSANAAPGKLNDNNDNDNVATDQAERPLYFSCVANQQRGHRSTSTSLSAAHLGHVGAERGWMNARHTATSTMSTTPTATTTTTTTTTTTSTMNSLLSSPMSSRPPTLNSDADPPNNPSAAFWPTAIAPDEPAFDTPSSSPQLLKNDGDDVVFPSPSPYRTEHSILPIPPQTTIDWTSPETRRQQQHAAMDRRANRSRCRCCGWRLFTVALPLKMQRFVKRLAPSSSSRKIWLTRRTAKDDEDGRREEVYHGEQQYGTRAWRWKRCGRKSEEGSVRKSRVEIVDSKEV